MTDQGFSEKINRFILKTGNNIQKNCKYIEQTEKEVMIFMKKDLEIEKVIGREIIDSRGNPTVEAEVILADGTIGMGTAPSGASTGEFEALELRDNDGTRYGGKGVSRAAAHINSKINAVLKGQRCL